MKTAADNAVSRRSQPMRQTRTNPPRASGHSRSGAGRDVNAGPAPDQPIEIFPAITHFADAITALPKELVRHFTLLKEVDAKICAPEEHLHKLVEACLHSQYPQPTPTANDAPGATTGADAASTQNPRHGIALEHNVQPLPVTDESYKAAVFAEENMPRRQLFLTTAQHVKEMLMSLEEKNHVISTANEALQRQLSRIEDVWPHVEREFSAEAKYGSTTHWAYPENRAGKPAHNERGRHGGIPNISAAAQQLAEEAAARSESRKQAVQAKKNAKNQHGPQESDFDDHDKHKGDGKKSHSGSKVRKTAEASGSVGLGISTGGPANGNPPAKRRKVEKPVNGSVGTGAERAIATVLNNSASKTKPTSPRETPAPEGQKKRKALPTGPTQTKKRNGVGTSSATSSPVLGAFPDNKASARNSPGPAGAPRPVTSRARQNSGQGTAENAKARPSSSASNKPNGIVLGTPDLAPPVSWPRSAGEPKPPKEPSSLSKVENSKKDPEPAETGNGGTASAKKDPVKTEEVEKKNEPAPPIQATTVLTTVTTKSGRASKPSTPALATFQEAARSRASRANEITAKRSHKKGAGTAAQAVAAREAADDDANSSLQGDDEEGDIDADEPTYCYCNSVSYGAMVACDADDCQREWFHLECVGLKVAPKQNVKWYCEDCKERLKAGGKKVNGR